MHAEDKKTERGLRAYIPLIVIVTLTLLAALVRQHAVSDGWSTMSWMHDWMGFFLVVFSMFKFFDLPGFAKGFEMYDLLAKRTRSYAYVYPFIELGLGLGYLSRWNPMVVYALTVAVMLFGTLGVLSALKKGLDINCPCPLHERRFSAPFETVSRELPSITSVNKRKYEGHLQAEEFVDTKS